MPSGRTSRRGPAHGPRVIVVGAGVVGLLTALECAHRGADVDVLEQGAIPNPLGTSYDHHRILRAAHPGDPAATARAVRALADWRALQDELGEPLIVRTGALTVCDERPAAVAPAERDESFGWEWLAPHALAATYPRLRIPAGCGGLFEPDAGVVLAERALHALVARLAALGVRLQAGMRVFATGAGWARCANGHVARGDRVVLAAGPWSRALVDRALAARLRLFRQSVLYVRSPAAGALPAIPALGDGSWLVPAVAGTPMKFSAAWAARPAHAVNGTETPAGMRAALTGRLARRLPGLQVAGARDFYYLADAETGGAVQAVLHDGTPVLAACGGNSFKFAPLIARSLAVAALDPMEAIP